MQLVRIAGPAEPMRRLSEVAGLEFERTSATKLEGDTWRVSGYATDEALEELRGRGLSVELVVESAQLEEQRATLFHSITRADAGDAGPGSA